jgi:hypothetical protein
MGRLHGLDQQGSAAMRRADVLVERPERVILILPDNGRGDGPTPLPPLPPTLPSLRHENA